MQNTHKHGTFTNPYDAKNEKFTQLATDYQSEKLAQKAAKIYADLPYEKEYKSAYILSSCIAFGAGAISFFTAFFAAKFVLSFILGAGVATVCAAVLCLGFELLKAFIWQVTVKGKKRYQKTNAALIVVLVFLHVISLGASVFGAYILPNDAMMTGGENAHTSTLNTFDGAKQLQNLDGQISQVDAQIAAYTPHLTKANGKKSSSTAAEIAALRTQKDALIKQREKAANTALQDSEKAKSDKETAQEKANAERGFIQLLCCILAAFFEVIYIFAVLFIFHYLFRVYLDSNAKTLLNAHPVANDAQSVANDAHPVANDAHRIAIAQNAPQLPTQTPPQTPRKIGFFYGENGCTTGAQTVRSEESTQIGNDTASNDDGLNDDDTASNDDDTNGENTYILTFSNGVPVAKIGDKLYTIDRARSNCSAAKSKANKVKKTPNKHGERAKFWADIVNDLSRLKP